MEDDGEQASDIGPRGSELGRKPNPEVSRRAERDAMRIAARQWSALSRAQAVKAGLTVHQIVYRVQTGRWREPVRGVYVVAGSPDRWEQRLMVACLAGPAGTVASHSSAAALFALGKVPEVPQVTVPPKASGRFKGALTFHRAVGPGESCVRRNIPCTTPTRTIVDCAAAGLLNSEDIAALVDTALCKKLMQPSRLVQVSGRAWRAARGERRRHLENLELALHVWRSGAPAGSPPEARLQRRLIEWGYPRAERQIEIFDEDGRFVARADVGLRDLKIVFEYDSDEHHGPRFWIADDTRADRIEELDWIVVRVDRFDLRPSNTRLRDVLDRRARLLGVVVPIQPPRSVGIVPEERGRTEGPIAPAA